MTGQAYTVPRPQRELATRRTEFLIKLITNFGIPLRTALESAYFQGMSDLYEVMKDIK